MRWVRRLLQAALLLLLLAGVAAAGFRAAMHYAPEYRERLVAELETRLQADVEIGRLNLAWEGFGPAVSMQEVRLQAADAAPLRADALRVGLDPLRLLRGQLQPRRITIDGAEVVVHHAQGRWQLRGLPRAEGDADPEMFWRTLESLDSIRVRNAVLHLPAVPAGALAPTAAGDAAAARDTAAASGEAQPQESTSPGADADADPGASAQAAPEPGPVSAMEPATQPAYVVELGRWDIAEARWQRRFGGDRLRLEARRHGGGALLLEVGLLEREPVAVQVEASNLDLAPLRALWPRAAAWPAVQLLHLEGEAERDAAGDWPFGGRIHTALQAPAVLPADADAGADPGDDDRGDDDLGDDPGDDLGADQAALAGRAAGAPVVEVDTELVVQGPLTGVVRSDGLRVESPDLAVVIGRSSWPRQALWFEYSGGVDPLLALQAEWLDLGDLWPLLRPSLARPLPVDSLAGALSDVTLEWRVPEGRPALTARLNQVGFGLDAPEIRLLGLSGEVSSAGNRGRLLLNAQEVDLHWPALFEDSTRVDSLAGTLDWALSDAGLQLELPDLAYAVSGVDGVGRLSREAQGAWHADFRFLSPDVTTARGKVPLIWQPSLRRWLEAAANAGELREGHVRLQGQGREIRRTEVDLALNEVELRFAPGWRPLLADEGTVRIRDRDLDVLVPSGRIGDLAVRDIAARMRPDPGGLLLIDAVLQGDAATVLDTLLDSPLEPQVRAVVNTVQARGPMTAQLDLALDLRRQERPRWSAQAQLDGVRLDISGWPSPLNDLRGPLLLGSEGLASDGLRGAMNGWPLRLRASRRGGRSTVRASGPVRLDEIPTDWPLPMWLQNRLHGTTQVAVETEFGGSAPPLLTLRTDLVGAAVALPPPLAKPVEQARRTLLRYRPRAGTLELAYDRALGLSAQRLGTPQQRLALHFGSDRLAPSPAEGLWIDGSLPTLHLGAWLDLLEDMRGGPATPAQGDGGEPPAPDFGGLSLALGGLRYQGQLWPQVNLQVLRSGESWLINLDGESLQGQLLATRDGQGRGAFAGQFERLDWRFAPPESTAAATDEEGRAAAPARGVAETLPQAAEAPALDLRVSRFRLNDEDLGPLTLALRPSGGGTAIETLRIGGDTTPQLALSGRLQPEGGAASTLRFEIDVDDADPWLRALGYAGQLRAEQLSAEGGLMWRRPEDLAALRLNGHVRFDLDEGRLVSVDPGAGRLLGLLSVTALPRRFLLDFSDLTDSGLAFDSLSGSYALEEGVARTDNLRINGPSVRVEARGEVDLVQRVQDQRVTIYPGISHGLTAAATVLGGPAVGLFMLFAQELLDKPLDQVGQISYRLSGPLDNPQVEPLQ